jgi:hypothetical protein
MSSKISRDVINKISDSLEKSSFGSGEMIAGILTDPRFQMPYSTGVWEISEERTRDGEYYYDYRHRRDKYMRGPSWEGRISFSVDIRDKTLEFLLGCGTHHAFCVFDKKTGELLEVIPDGLPSNSFWGDGDHPDLSLRAKREYTRMTHAPVHSEHA